MPAQQAKPSVLIIGGTGIISSDVVCLAAERGDFELCILNRGASPSFLPPGLNILTVDINNPDAARAALAGKTFDVVCDFITYDTATLQKRLDLFRDRCGQYVFISSTAAYRVGDENVIVTEANNPVGNRHWSYGYNKAQCERLLAAERARGGPAFTIVRPSYTYNNIRFFNPYTINHWESWTLADRLLRGAPYVLPGDGESLCTITHTTDFAKAFVGLWGNPKAMDEAFHITSAEYPTWRQVAEIQADILGVKVDFCCVDPDDLCFDLDWTATEKINHTVRHARFDSAKVRAAVPEFVCTTSFAEGIARTIHFYQENPAFQKINAWWNAGLDRAAARQRGR